MLVRFFPALVAGALGFVSLPALAQDPNNNSKQSLGSADPSDPSSDEVTREEALAALEAGEALLESSDQDSVVSGLTLMLMSYALLEGFDGAEARGVIELRSWLVKAFETAGLTDEAKELRARGSYVDHPLTVMPSTWFKAKAGADSGASATMSITEAEAAVERGLNMLTEGNIDGLGLLFEAYEAVERLQGAESGDAVILRSFLVNLLEAGGFVDEAKQLRARGSVTAPTAEDNQVYAATWARVIEAEQSKTSKLSGLSGANLKLSTNGAGSSDSGAGSSGSSASGSSTSDSSASGSTGDTEPEPDKPKVVQAGSAIPAILIDLGVGSFQPELGTKGFVWTLGLGARWTLFSARFFSMQIGGAGSFGRNRDKRWLTDVSASLGLDFDFSKLYITPEFGGGYDGISGGSRDEATALRVYHAGYYHFGGTLGVRFAERFGIYGRAVRLNRAEEFMPNETRVRGGFVIQLADRGAVDLAFVFTDYEPAEGRPGARLYTGNLGIRF